ncbi:hypothetical protein Tco_0299438 [Tanacetum coccineum]
MVDEDKEFDEVRVSTEDVVSTDKEGVSTDFEKVSTDRPKVSTDESKVSTDEQVEGTGESNESTEDQTKEEIASKASQTSTQTPTSMTFGDDETIATLLLNMSQAKAASKEKSERCRIDPKDKGKKKIVEEDESESEDDDIPQAVKKFKQLETLIKNFDDIKARIEADRILAEKLQEQEREQSIIEERAMFLHDTIAALRNSLHDKIKAIRTDLQPCIN